MKLLFIFTGGTIGSTRKGDVIATDGAKSRLLIDAYKAKYGLNCDYHCIEPYTQLSENNTGEHIAKLIAAVKDNIDGDYDGIIVTHGTDTLQYTAAALGYCLGNDTIPVCLVSSNYPIENKSANGLENLHAAVCFIRGGYGRGVFVPYKSYPYGVEVHRGTRLLPAIPFTDKIYSALGSTYGRFDNDFTFDIEPYYEETKDKIPPFDGKLTATNDGVCYLPAIVGLPYPTLDDNVKCVLLGSYHSGTLNTQSEDALRFFAQAKERKIPVFACGVTDGPSYASAQLFDSLGITPLPNVSPIAAYVKLWLLLSEGKDVHLVHLSLAGDVIGD